MNLFTEAARAAIEVFAERFAAEQEDFADQIVTRLRRIIREETRIIMANLTAITAEVTRISDEATEQSTVIDAVLARLEALDVQDDELAALTEQLRTAGTSIDEGTTRLVTAIAETPEEPPVEEPPA